jgi:hypothetical protein
LGFRFSEAGWSRCPLPFGKVTESLPRGDPA